MTPSSDDPRPPADDRPRRRPLLFGRPPLDDPVALDQWIGEFVAEANAALEEQRRGGGATEDESPH